MPIARRHFPILMGEKGDLDVVEVDNTIRNSWLAVYALQQDVTLMQEKVAGAIRRGEIASDDQDASISKVAGATRTAVVTGPTSITGAKLVNPISGRLPFVNGAHELDGGVNAPEYNSSTKALTIRGALNITGVITGLSTMAITGAVTMASTLAVTGNTTLGNTLVITGATTGFHFEPDQVGGGPAGATLYMGSVPITPTGGTHTLATVGATTLLNAATLVRIDIGNVLKASWSTIHVSQLSTIYANAAGPRIDNSATSATNPVFIPSRADVNTGIGGDAGEVSIITGSTSAINVDSSQNVVLSATLNVIGALTLTVPLAVPQGGTGAATFTDGGIMLGSGTGILTVLGQATNGQLPIGSTGADPVLGTLTGTANEITVVNGAGSITLSQPTDVTIGGILTVTGNLNHDGTNIGFFGTAPAVQAGAYTRNATIVEDRTLLASASATIINNNNVLAALIADLQAYGLIQ